MDRGGADAAVPALERFAGALRIHLQPAEQAGEGRGGAGRRPHAKGAVEAGQQALAVEVGIFLRLAPAGGAGEAAGFGEGGFVGGQSRRSPRWRRAHRAVQPQ